MSLIAIRTQTHTGERIHFEDAPASSKAPLFCEGHPFAERDHALSETFLPAPFGTIAGRLWHHCGVVQASPIADEPEDDEEAEEV